MESNSLAIMKPHARRIAIGAAALVAVLLAVLAVVNWGIVRDHVEVWHFQLTRDTKAIQPLSRDLITAARYDTQEEYLLHVAAAELRCPVIVDPKQVSPLRVVLIPGAMIYNTLRKEGWRLLKQHFPRRAYVLIRANNPLQDLLGALPPGTRHATIQQGAAR